MLLSLQKGKQKIIKSKGKKKQNNKKEKYTNKQQQNKAQPTVQITHHYRKCQNFIKK